MTLLYKADPVRGQRWQALFAELAPELEIRLWPDVGDPADIRFLSAWTLEPGLKCCSRSARGSTSSI